MKIYCLIITVFIFNYTYSRNQEEIKKFCCIAPFDGRYQSYIIGSIATNTSDFNEYTVTLKDVHLLRTKFEYNSSMYVPSIFRIMKDGYDINAELYRLLNGVSVITNTRKHYYLLTDVVMQSYSQELFGHRHDSASNDGKPPRKCKLPRLSTKALARRMGRIKEQKHIYPINTNSKNFKLYKKAADSFHKLQTSDLARLSNNTRLLRELHSMPTLKQKSLLISMVIDKYAELNREKIIDKYLFTYDDSHVCTTDPHSKPQAHTEKEGSYYKKTFFELLDFITHLRNKENKKGANLLNIKENKDKENIIEDKEDNIFSDTKEPKIIHNKENVELKDMQIPPPYDFEHTQIKQDKDDESYDDEIDPFFYSKDSHDDDENDIREQFFEQFKAGHNTKPHWDTMNNAFYSILLDYTDVRFFDVFFKINAQFVKWENNLEVIKLIKDDDFNKNGKKEEETNMFDDKEIKCYYFDGIVINDKNKVIEMEELIPLELVKDYKINKNTIENKEEEEMIIMKKKMEVRSVMFEEEMF